MNRKILAIALPSIAANITTPLLGLVDTAIVGHMGSAVYIAAIAVGGVMFNMLYWLFSFLRGGTSGLSAQAYGAGDTKAQTIVLWRSLLVAFAAALIMVVLQRPLCRLLLAVMSPDEATAVLATRYFSILIYGAPATLAMYALSGWFLGMQNSRMLFVTSLVINLVNIAVSLTLVYGLGWQIAGVASGTLVAQWAGLAVGFLLLRRYKMAHVTARELFERSGVLRFFKVNVHVMLRTLCLIAVTVWFARVGASQGSIILAVNTLLMQLFLLFSYMMDGFAYAGEALAGRYLGAGDYGSLRRCVKLLFCWGGGFALLFTATYFFCGEPILHLLSSEPHVVAASANYALWAVGIPLAGFATFVWDGVFIGVTLTRELFLSMLGATCVFFAVYFALPQLGNHALWLAFLLYLCCRGLLQTIIYIRHKWK